MNNILVFGFVAIVLIVSVINTFQINALKNSSATVTGNVISSSGGIDMTGWTADEKMMYEHHGTLPERLQSGKSAPTSSGMVGGC